jgi:hypothetical protein
MALQITPPIDIGTKYLSGPLHLNLGDLVDSLKCGRGDIPTNWVVVVGEKDQLILTADVCLDRR